MAHLTGNEQTDTEAHHDNPELGWDNQTELDGVVVDFVTRQEVVRRVASAGQLVIKPQSTKPSKGTGDNTYIWYVIEGAVRVKIHNTTKVLCTGGMFLVPRGNNYSIENILTRDAKLFFSQARKVAVDEGI